MSSRNTVGDSTFIISGDSNPSALFGIVIVIQINVRSCVSGDKKKWTLKEKEIVDARQAIHSKQSNRKVYPAAKQKAARNSVCIFLGEKRSIDQKRRQSELSRDPARITR